MRVIVIMKSSKDSEAGAMPTEQQLRDMGNYNEELVKAGIMLSGEGLHPSSKGARVSFAGGRSTVTNGPFAQVKELVGGFWMWQVESMQEAIDWVRRCPIAADDQAEIEIRPVFEAEDFGAEFTPELREQEERLRAQVAAPASGVNPVPPPSGAVPYLVVKGAADAIGYYQSALGAELVARIDTPDGKVMHAEMKVGVARFMLTEESPQRQALGPLSLGGSAITVLVHVPDVDATVAKAIAAGAKPDMPVQDQFWGDRCGSITDPFGHQWLLATHIEDPSGEEVGRRVRAMFSQGAPC